MITVCDLREGRLDDNCIILTYARVGLMITVYVLRVDRLDDNCLLLTRG